MSLMKTSILFTFLLFATTIFAQGIDADEPITGLGDIYFGMNKKEVLEAVKPYTTANTALSIGYTGIVATPLMLAETKFDRCIFNFEEQELKKIVYEIYTDETNMDSEFRYLLEVLENDYGKHKNYMESDKEITEFRWFDGNVRLVLNKGYDKIRKMHLVTIEANWFRGLYKYDKYY